MEQTIKANGIEICYEAFGQVKDPSVLLVMGLGAQMTAWPPSLIEGLVEAGLQVVIYDNRDVGLSEKFGAAGVPNLVKMGIAQLFRRKLTAPYLFCDMAADGIGLLDALGIEKAHVVGASLGGMIVQQMAIDSPARLTSMTSIMSTTGDRSVPRGTFKAIGALMKAPPKTKDMTVILDSLMKKSKTIGGEGFIDDAATRDRPVRMMQRSVYPEGTLRQNACAMASGSRTQALKSVTTPTLVIHGDQDPLVRVEGGRHTAEVIPGARLEILKGMGHAMYPRYQPRILELIRDFTLSHEVGHVAEYEAEHEMV